MHLSNVNNTNPVFTSPEDPVSPRMPTCPAAGPRPTPLRGHHHAARPDLGGHGLEILRHSTLSSTTRIHGHLLRDVSHQAVEAIDNALANASVTRRTYREKHRATSYPIL